MPVNRVSVLRDPARARVTLSAARTGLPAPIDHHRTSAVHVITAVAKWREMYVAQQPINPLIGALAEGLADRKG